jgi:biopolymer transport protein ExbD
MGFSTHTKKSKGVSPVMNVTPLVDVVLVLLIIFMVITPMLSKHIHVRVPEENSESSDEKSPDPLVLSVLKDGSVFLNKEQVNMDVLVEKLQRVFSARQDYTVFFDAPDDVAYGTTAMVLNKARMAGALNIAMATSAVNP